MRRLMLLVIVALVFSSITHRMHLHGEEPATEVFARAKPLVEEGTGIAGLKQAKYNAALREFQSRDALWRGGKGSLVDLISAASRLRRSELDPPTEKLRTHFRFAQELEGQVQERFKNGINNAADLELARYHRIDLEIRLLKE